MERLQKQKREITVDLSSLASSWISFFLVLLPWRLRTGSGRKPERVNFCRNMLAHTRTTWWRWYFMVNYRYFRRHDTGAASAPGTRPTDGGPWREDLASKGAGRHWHAIISLFLNHHLLRCRSGGSLFFLSFCYRGAQWWGIHDTNDTF